MAALSESTPHDNADEGSAEPHALEVTAWDVPATTVAGERFMVSVGARCSAGCNLGGRELHVADDQGSALGTFRLGHDVWPDTEALYFGRLEARAPTVVGSHPLKLRIAETDAERPHAPGAFAMVLHVVPSPDCEVTVRAIDEDTKTPIEGARVVMHPYRAVTDGSGIARLRVARGQYDILVSGSSYVAACVSVDVAADMMTSAELEADRPWAPPDEDLG